MPREAARSLLADLSHLHPHLDAEDGTDDEGFPWFAMVLADGASVVFNAMPHGLEVRDWTMRCLMTLRWEDYAAPVVVTWFRDFAACAETDV